MTRAKRADESYGTLRKAPPTHRHGKSKTMEAHTHSSTNGYGVTRAKRADECNCALPKALLALCTLLMPCSPEGRTGLVGAPTPAT